MPELQLLLLEATISCIKRKPLLLTSLFSPSHQCITIYESERS